MECLICYTYRRHQNNYTHDFGPGVTRHCDVNICKCVDLWCHKNVPTVCKSSKNKKKIKKSNSFDPSGPDLHLVYYKHCFHSKNPVVFELSVVVCPWILSASIKPVCNPPTTFVFGVNNVESWLRSLLPGLPRTLGRCLSLDSVRIYQTCVQSTTTFVSALIMSKADFDHCYQVFPRNC